MNRISRIAAAIVIVATVAGTATWLTVGNGGASVAFAQVLEGIRAAETVTFTTTTAYSADDEPLVITYMLMTPGRSRITMGGLVWIMDSSKGKILILDPAKKTGATIGSETQQHIPNIIETLKTIRAGAEEESLGTKEIDGREVVGFLIHKKGKDITVWVDPATELPIRIEAEETVRGGAKARFVYSDIEFNAALDESLFSTDLPDGYTEGDLATLLLNTGSLARARRSTKRAISATNMDRLVKACNEYAQRHDGEWPESLEQLGSNLENTKKHLMNPNEKDPKVVYVYVKPTGPSDSGKLMMYELQDIQWKSGTTVVLNGQMTFIADEDDFKQLLSSTKSE